MPTPAPNMPMHRKYKMSCQAGGSGKPSHTMAWITTAMLERPATDAAQVCTKFAPCLPSGP
jgi:hypothetical protein